MARRRRRRGRSIDEAMRWSLDMGRAGKRRRGPGSAARNADDVDREDDERDEPTTLPPDPPREDERAEPQPDLVDESAVQLTRR